MTDVRSDSPVWRQALIAMGAVLGASALFLSALMLLLGTVLDHTVSSSSSSKDLTAVEAPAAGKDKDKSKPVPPTGKGLEKPALMRTGGHS